MVARCIGTTKDGKPCAAKPRPGTQLCPWHSPDLAARRVEWSAKGGASKSNKARAKKALPDEPLSTDELLAYLSVAFKAVLSGKLTPNIGNALGTLARTMAEIRKTTEIEARLDALEACANDRGLA
jgi:hypothetical protein